MVRDVAAASCPATAIPTAVDAAVEHPVENIDHTTTAAAEETVGPATAVSKGGGAISVPQGSPSRPCKGVPLPVPVKLTKMEPDDDPEALLVTFQRVVLAAQWPPRTMGSDPVPILDGSGPGSLL